jgi:hypothetical protein
MIVASADDDAQPGFEVRLFDDLSRGFMAFGDRSGDPGVAGVQAGLMHRRAALHSGKNLTEGLGPPGRADTSADVENRLMVGYSDQAPFASPNHFPYTKTTSEFLGNFF